MFRQQQNPKGTEISSHKRQDSSISSDNRQGRELQINHRKQLCLLQEEGGLIDKLTLAYQALTQQIEGHQQLQATKQEMERGRLSFRSEEDKALTSLQRKAKELRETCAVKERQLATVKEGFISNIGKTKTTKVESLLLRQQIKAKEQECDQLQAAKRQRTLDSNHLELNIQKTGNELKRQREKKHRLHLQLMEVREADLSTRSALGLKQQIARCESQAVSMEKLVRELGGL